MGLSLGLLIFLHAGTLLLHKSFICMAVGWWTCNYSNFCFRSNSADVSGKGFLLEKWWKWWLPKPKLRGIRDRPVWWFLISLSFLGCGKKTTTNTSDFNEPEESWRRKKWGWSIAASLSVSIMFFFLCYIHKIFKKRINWQRFLKMEQWFHRGGEGRHIRSEKLQAATFSIFNKCESAFPDL